MASASSSSSSQLFAPRKYDVFISFRGEDTCNNFTSHLHVALTDDFLETFRDDKQLEKGDEIAPSLIKAIKDSIVSVVVFSEDYASSRWCLDELVQIMQYRKHEGQFVIPIFYKVDPSHVRRQTGAYEKAFEEHEKKYRNDSYRVNRWRAALSEAGNLSGWHCQSFTDESNLIQEIVADVRTKLEHIHNGQRTLKDVIGIDEMAEPIEGLLEKFDKVGIWGMGGVGKTTMAKAIFAKLSSRYDSCCFLENIREETEKKGLRHVSNSLVLELLGRDMQCNPSNALRDAFVARRLGCKKALVVLDDVDSSEQLEDLQNKVCNFLGEGSKVIITTRDKQLLLGNSYEVYAAKGLSCENSRQLFIGKAFGSDHPEDGYEQLIEGFVAYTQHNPLALKVLGSYVRSRDKTFWDGALRKLRAGRPHGKIQKVLRLSYDGLEREEKQIFLDIACFLKGESETFVKELFNSYEFHPTVGIQTLNDKALIVTTNGKVEMHELIQEMGLQIVREESIDEPGKRSRLCDSREIYEVLENCEGGKKVEGIIFNISGISKSLELTEKTFNKMKRIRFLKFYSPSEPSYTISIPKGLEQISSKIRYFHWKAYSGKSLPSNFCANLLLELNIEHGSIETLWEGVQDLVNLKRLKLRGCKKLRKLPDFSKACGLESVDLTACKGLCDVHPSLLSLHSLISLDVSYCERLTSLKSGIHLKSLKQVAMYYCFQLEEFSMSSEELTSLDLSETQITELSPSIGRCSKLRALDLHRRRLNNLPIEVLSRLTSLEHLNISLWQENDDFGLCLLFDPLCSLKSVILWAYHPSLWLPDNIGQLSNLEALHLIDWSNHQYLSELPPSLKSLKATDSVVNLYSIHHLTNLSCLHLNTSSFGSSALSLLCCFKLLVELHIRKWQTGEEIDLGDLFDGLPSLQKLHLEEWINLTELPDNISHLSQLQFLSIPGCITLRSLPQLPPSLRVLIATNCRSLQTVSTSTISSTPENYGEKLFSFVKCVNLDLGAIEEQAKSLLQKAVHEKEDAEFHYPGKKVPEWFGNSRTQNDLDFTQLSLASHDLVGFIFCAVIPDYDVITFPPVAHIEFGFKLDEMTTRTNFFYSDKFCAGNVLLCSDPRLSELILKKIDEGNGRNHEATTNNRNLFFRFGFYRRSTYYFNKECGVYPVYSSEYYNNVDRINKGNRSSTLIPKKRKAMMSE